MGKLSDIYSSYKRSLDSAQDRYEGMITGRSKSSEEFYREFFRDLVVNIGSRMNDPARGAEWRRLITDRISDFFGKTEIQFVAVDGSCDRHPSGEFVSFYGGAYGSKGVLTIGQADSMIEYKRWEMDKDVSMVAFVPIPYTQMPEVEEEARDGRTNDFAVSEEDRINLASIHIPIMQLAEVFLAYNSATSSSTDSPNLILIDNTLSGMLGYNDFGPEQVRMVGHRMPDGRVLEKHDVVVAQAHPFNRRLGVPSGKKFSAKFAVIQAMQEIGQERIPLEALREKAGIGTAAYARAVMAKLEDAGIARMDGDVVVRLADPYQSWEKTKSTFQGICKMAFMDKAPDALRYTARDDGGADVTRWMSPEDVRFLIATGLKALIEECWERKIMLTGIAKDSSSAYMTRNYLGVCRHLRIYPRLAEREFGHILPTDRSFCELIPYIDEGVESPWGTVEFDSTFMTLRATREEGTGRVRLGGSYGGITRPERLFLRSIGQFYAKQREHGPLTGHAIFIDRLAFPELDAQRDGPAVESGEIGAMRPLFYLTSADENVGQAMTYFLLNEVTKNHFPEMIGYPDPLHKADQGAKSMRDSVGRLLSSSEIKFRSRPLTNTLRGIRQAVRRRGAGS